MFSLGEQLHLRGFRDDNLSMPMLLLQLSYGGTVVPWYFSLGATIVVLVFYMRQEARQLERELLREEVL